MLLTSVKSNMNLETAHCREELIAHITAIVFDTSVCFYVGCQSGLDSKGTKTLGAFVRLLMAVNTDMTH